MSYLARLASGKLARRSDGKLATTCVPPTGACCRNGVCTVTTQAECAASGGYWLGPGTTCAGVTCPPVGQGACFRSTCDQTICDVRTPLSCAGVPGTFLGLNVPCSAADLTNPLWPWRDNERWAPYALLQATRNTPLSCCDYSPGLGQYFSIQYLPDLQDYGGVGTLWVTGSDPRWDWGLPDGRVVQLGIIRMPPYTQCLWRFWAAIGVRVPALAYFGWGCGGSGSSGPAAGSMGGHTATMDIRGAATATVGVSGVLGPCSLPMNGEVTATPIW